MPAVEIYAPENGNTAPILIGLADVALGADAMDVQQISQTKYILNR